MRKLLILFVFLPVISAAAATTYFVDNLSGNDGNSGTSPASAFNSIEQVNKLQLSACDSVLFRRGGEWIGNLRPRGSGSEGKLIVIGAYGNGPAPVLDAMGEIAEGEDASYTIRLFNQQYIEIRDLQIRNFKPFEVPRKIESRGNASYVNSRKMGIYIEGKDCGTLHDIRLINLEICDVNGDMSTKHNGGVFIEITWDDDPSKRVKSNFDALHTEGCHIHHVDRTGWSNTSVWWDRSLTSEWGDLLANGDTHNWYPSENVVLRNNTFERAGANALIVRVSKAPLVEYCLFTHNGWKGSGNASFPFNCDDALFQFNEACYTVYNSEADSWDNRKDADAGGFDSDWNCKRSVFQYNYSHHNGYGGILICVDGKSKTGFNDGTIVRYNIFEDNEHHIVRTSGPVTNTRIYNNVFYSGDLSHPVMLLFHKSWGGYSDGVDYTNNIFVSGGNGDFFDFGESTRNSFLANILHGNLLNVPDDPQKITENPLFKGAHASGLNWKPVLRFMLRENSPARDSGVVADGHATRDFAGNPIVGKPDRGAFEFAHEF